MIDELSQNEEVINNSNIKVKERGIAKIPGDKLEKGEKFECFSVRFSKTDRFLGCGLSNGKIHLIDPISFKHEIRIIASDFPITGVRFKGDHSIMSVSANGKVSTWHTLTGKKLHSFEELNNPIMCLDINRDCTMFATGGNDKVVKLYDDDTKTLITELTPSYAEVGHSNRIFAVTFHKTDPNLLASGGWDSIVVFYDVRQKKIIGNVLGAHICGDSLDLKDNLVLTGSWKSTEQIKIFDIRKFELVETVKWGFDTEDKCSFAYAAQFSKAGNNNFAVGGSQENLWRIWDYKEPDRLKASGSSNLPGAAYSVDFSNQYSDSLAVGCGDGKIRIYDIGS